MKTLPRFFRRLAVCPLVFLHSFLLKPLAGQTSAAGAATNIVINQGGTYSGTWNSNDPGTPAVMINTDQPVIIQNSTVSGRGDLIYVNGNYGAHVTVQNVRGTALDPGVSGAQRGSFVRATKAASLTVTHCSMYGVSFGVVILYSAMETLTVSQNLASQLEDRASDGSGGFLNSRPSLGHFLMLNQVTALAGADISWNQVINTVGESSIEDVFNLFKSQGTAAQPIHVHDNYMEGFSSPATSSYTGTGIISDGDGQIPDTANVSIENNEVVHAAGSGIEIATGHNIGVKGNRIVLCGEDATGNWIAVPFANAIVMWNYYGTTAFVNNTVAGTQGGMLRPSSSGTPQVADLWAASTGMNATDTTGPNQFTDPCLVNGQVNLAAEDAERNFWQNKLAAAHISPGAED